MLEYTLAAPTSNSLWDILSGLIIHKRDHRTLAVDPPVRHFRLQTTMSREIGNNEPIDICLSHADGDIRLACPQREDSHMLFGHRPNCFFEGGCSWPHDIARQPNAG